MLHLGTAAQVAVSYLIHSILHGVLDSTRHRLRNRHTGSGLAFETLANAAHLMVDVNHHGGLLAICLTLTAITHAHLYAESHLAGRHL